MQNREITYYYLLADDILNHYYSLADGIPEDSFVKSGLEQKHLIHFNVHANNNAFLTHLAEQSDLKNLTTILQKQLARYLEHADGNSHDLKIGWLKQTVKICKDAYHQRKKKSQIWLEAAEWCEKELTESLKAPLGQQANQNSPLNSLLTNKNGYNLGDYALMQVYLSLTGEGESVTNTNKDTIADKYQLHGKRFYEAFNKYRNVTARTETVNERTDNEKKKRFEKVVVLLSPYPNALKLAIDEQKLFILASQAQYE